jgi:hypothetical protein
MEITIARTGGYAGLHEAIATIDTTRLSPKMKADIEAAVANANFFALPERVQGKEIGADLQAYEVTVDDGPRHHTVTFPDESSTATAQLMALVGTIMAAR